MILSQKNENLIEKLNKFEKDKIKYVEQIEILSNRLKNNSFVIKVLIFNSKLFLE